MAPGGMCGGSGGENAGFRDGRGGQQRSGLMVAVETKREESGSVEGKEGGTAIRWRQRPVAAAAAGS